MALAYLPIPILFIIMLLEQWHDRDRSRIRSVRTNVLIGITAALVAIGARVVFLAFFNLLHAHALLPDLGHSPGTWVACFVVNELCFYWHHRLCHRVRLLWASHSTHHSDDRFDLSVGFRLPITHGLRQFFWLPMPLLGFDPLMVLACESVSLIYGFLLHTEWKAPRNAWTRRVEWIFNTPALHRVHHASNEQYMDRNYGGMLILWDRLFGTYLPEDEAPRYGITEKGPHHTWQQAMIGGYQRLWNTTRCLRGWPARLRYVLSAPDAAMPAHSASSIARYVRSSAFQQLALRIIGQAQRAMPFHGWRFQVPNRVLSGSWVLQLGVLLLGAACNKEDLPTPPLPVVPSDPRAEFTGSWSIEDHYHGQMTVHPMQITLFGSADTLRLHNLWGDGINCLVVLDTSQWSHGTVDLTMIPQLVNGGSDNLTGAGGFSNNGRWIHYQTYLNAPPYSSETHVAYGVRQ